MGICEEHEKNIFITDAQTGSVKLITSIKGIVKYLIHLALLYKVFSIHMKHQTVPKRSLSQAIKLLKELDSYLETITEKALLHSNDVNNTSTGKPSGSQGTISNQTKHLVNMILNGLKDLEALVKEHNPSFAIDLYSCLTVQVENLHAVGHFKDQFPTLLQYAPNLANTVYESIKRVVPWSASYFTHDKSDYPVLCQSTPLNAILKLKLGDKQWEGCMTEKCEARDRHVQGWYIAVKHPCIRNPRPQCMRQSKPCYPVNHLPFHQKQSVLSISVVRK